MRYEGKANSLVEAKEKAVEIIKEHIKKNGIKLPFEATNLTYSNAKIDNWLRIKEDGKLKKYNRQLEKMEVSND